MKPIRRESLSDARILNEKYPGYLIRRLQQVSSSIFFSHLRPFDLTPIQHTILRVLADLDDVDQRSLATLAGLDSSTTTDVLARLAEKKLVIRSAGPVDRRTRVVKLTAAGRRMLQKVQPDILAGQEELLRPLTPARRRALTRALLDLIDGHEVNGDEGRTGPWRRFR